MDARTEAPEHRRKIVLGMRAERAGTESDSIRRGINRRQNRREIVLRARDAGQAEDGEGRIIRMDAKGDTNLLRDGDDMPQKRRVVFPQSRGIDGRILGQLGAEFIQRHVVDGAGQAQQNGPLDRVLFFACHGGETFRRLRDIFRRMVLLRTGPLEDMKIEDGRIDGIEAQGLRAIRQQPVELRARPIEQRHEVVANDGDPAGGQVAQALAIVGQIARTVALGLFDVLVDRNAFDHRPAEPSLFNESLVLFDFLDGPHRAVRHMM